MSEVKKHGSSKLWHDIVYLGTSLYVLYLLRVLIALANDCANSVTEAVFFSALVLVGAGWSYLKPFLGTRDKYVVVIVLTLQVWTNAAQVVKTKVRPAACRLSLLVAEGRLLRVAIPRRYRLLNLAGHRVDLRHLPLCDMPVPHAVVH